MSLVPWYETHYMIVTIIVLEIQCIKKHLKNIIVGNYLLSG